MSHTLVLKSEDFPLYSAFVHHYLTFKKGQNIRIFIGNTQLKSTAIIRM